jgi:DNA-binding phage protein
MLSHQGNPTMSNISAVFAALKRQLTVGDLARALKLRCDIFCPHRIK